MSVTSRAAAVAGTFYPDRPEQLSQLIDNLLAAKSASPLNSQQVLAIKALIVPHAGLIYSGAVAASAYRLLKPRRQAIQRVVLLGPNHRVPLRGLALPSVDQFTTPIGSVKLDNEGKTKLLTLTNVRLNDEAHALEHSLEVQLPFLQAALENFYLLPLVVGTCTAEEVQQALRLVWGGEETLVIVSSDLSHFNHYDSARTLDRQTTDWIVQKHWHLGSEQACGAYPLNGLLKHAEELGLCVCPLDLRNSGDTAGSKDRVVGYGAYAIY